MIGGPDRRSLGGSRGSSRWFSSATDEDTSPFWPLDLAIGGLVVVSMGVILQRLDVGGPDIWRDARTYLLIALILGIAAAVVSRVIGDRLIRRSVQFALVGSLFTHLVLTVAAINYDVFTPYFATARAGVKPERAPIKRTVPDYLFQNRPQSTVAADWSKPVDAETASPIRPQEVRKLPPVDQTAARLELPSPTMDRLPTDAAHLRRRDEDSPALPTPSNAPSQLAKRDPAPPPTRNELADAPEIPEMSLPAAAEAPSPPSPAIALTPDRNRNARADLPTSDAALESLLAPTPPRLMTGPLATRSANARNAPGIPTLGGGEVPRPHRRRQSDRVAMAAAGPPPPIASVPVIRETPSATLSIGAAALAAPPTHRSRRAGVDIDSMAAGNGNLPTPSATSVPLALSAAAGMGMPSIETDSAGGQSGMLNRQRPADLFALDPAANPNTEIPVPVASATDRSTTALPEAAAPPPVDRRRSQQMSSIVQAMNIDSLSLPSIDMDAADGPVGFDIAMAPAAGLVPDDSAPAMPEPMDLSPTKRLRRDVGGIVVPAGSKVAAVETFARRIKRTSGGAAPAPAGEVGPDTEEAIERGLAYLADTQNEDGSWSLQGHGDEVVLRSDTAATGLALLSFQGAGYTHRQHKYADTVARGIEWLKANQRSNGNLYRSENDLSDRNVALYSHGIAALAMSEAFGMTQDEEIRGTAQAALDYIVSTQHREYGGWRYAPQASSDTSVTGWMMMALKSGQLGGLEVPQKTYDGINQWLNDAEEPDSDGDRYRYNPYAADTPAQRHGRLATPSMTAVGMLMRMYSGWRRENPAMQSAAEYLLRYPPMMGDPDNPQRDAYYWYYATQVMFHMGGETWQRWNQYLNPVLLKSQLIDGPYSGSWDPNLPVKDRWNIHGGRMYVTTMNLLNLEVYYRHLPIYEDTAK